MRPFGPVHSSPAKGYSNMDSLDGLRKKQSSEIREQLLCNASQCLYEGLKSLMEAVVLEEAKEARQEPNDQSSSPANMEAAEREDTLYGESPEATLVSPTSEPPYSADTEDLDGLDNHPTIACWSEDDMDSMPSVYKSTDTTPDREKTAKISSEDIAKLGPLSPFYDTQEVEGTSVPSPEDLYGSEMDSKITPMTPPSSLTELHPLQEQEQSELDSLHASPHWAESPFSVVNKDQAGDLSQTTSHLTPESIPAGEGTPAGPDSVTDPLDGEQTYEIPKHILSFKKQGNYPFQDTIPAPKSKRKAG